MSTSPAPTAHPPGLDRTGLAAGFGAYLVWGMFPVYFHLFTRTGAVEVVAYRVVWGLVVSVLLVVLTRRWRAFVALVWVALAILTADALRVLRRPRDLGPRG